MNKFFLPSDFLIAEYTEIDMEGVTYSGNLNFIRKILPITASAGVSVQDILDEVQKISNQLDIELENDFAARALPDEDIRQRILLTTLTENETFVTALTFNGFDHIARNIYKDLPLRDHYRLMDRRTRLYARW